MTGGLLAAGDRSPADLDVYVERRRLFQVALCMTAVRFAQQLIREVFCVVPRKWRGIGEIPQSGLGLSEKYDDNWVGHYYVQKSSLIGLTLTPAVSYRVNDWFSVGAGLSLLLQTS